MSEDALTDCPCGSKGTLKRVIQPVGVLFKGAGFHINDYAGKSEPAATKAEDAKPSESPTTPEKTDTTPKSEGKTSSTGS